MSLRATEAGGGGAGVRRGEQGREADRKLASSRTRQAMERWTALVPKRAHSGVGLKPVDLIGRLPPEAYLVVLQFLPIPDIPAFALCCHRLARLSRDDTVWRAKLTWLDYRGPGASDWRTRREEETRDEVPRPVRPPTPPLFAAEPDVDDEFGDFFEGQGAGDLGGAALVNQDDGFGDFQDFVGGGGGVEELPRAAPLSLDPFGMFDEEQAPISRTTTASTAADDLMMMFDDDDGDVSLAPPQRPSIDTRLTFEPISVVVAPIALTPAEPSSDTPSESRPLRDVFIRYHSLLLPYYLSLVTHTTSSLVFTSPTLTPSTRSQILSSLVRFCLPLLAPTRSLPQRTTVLRNVQSATDFFESALLAEFERADTRRDEESMRDKAKVLWDLNGSNSVVQVFVQKREIFYDQSHNPLKNLV